MKKSNFYDVASSICAVILIGSLDKVNDSMASIAIFLFYLILIIYFYKERIVVKWFYQKYSNKIDAKNKKYFDLYFKLRFCICIVLGLYFYLTYN